MHIIKVQSKDVKALEARFEECLKTPFVAAYTVTKRNEPASFEVEITCYCPDEKTCPLKQILEA